MKRVLYLLLLICLASTSLGGSMWASVEIYKENLFPVEDAEYLKKLVPKESDFLNAMVMASKQGKTFAYYFSVCAETWGERATAAVLYKPDDTPLSMTRYGTEFEFETIGTLYFSTGELAADFPPGDYRLDITFASGVQSWTIPIPDYNTTPFPDLPAVSLDQDGLGRLILDWSTVAGVEDYEVWAENLRGFVEVFDQDFDGAVHPDDFQTSLGLYASKGDYQIGVTADKFVSGGADYGIEFNTGSCLFSFKKPPVPIVNTAQKFDVKAGKTRGLDSITLSGLLDVLEADFLLADDPGDEEITITIDSALLADPIVCTFPINSKTLKKGVYNYSDKVQSLKADTKTGKFTFSAKNCNLMGLACPISVDIEIGDYLAEFELDETIVNGAKLPCPPQLLMGAANSLQINRSTVRFGKTANTDTLTVDGFFTVEGMTYDKNDPLVVVLGGQTFTIDGSRMTTKGMVEMCSRIPADEGGLITATFDFSKCTFKLSLTSVSITECNTVPFGFNLFDKDLTGFATIDLGPKRCFGIEDLRRYDELGAGWEYLGTYKITGAGMNESGSGYATVTVSDSTTWINGHECYEVSASAGEGEMVQCWYTDGNGTHLMSWGNDALGNFEIRMDTPLLVTHPLQCVGQQIKQGPVPFSGTFDLGYAYLDIDDFEGTVSSVIKLVGYEDLTVPQGVYEDTAKIQFDLTVTGTMLIIYDDGWDYGEFPAKFQATTKQTVWTVEGVGALKMVTDMTVRVSGKGLGSASVRITETDVLTDYWE